MAFSRYEKLVRDGSVRKVPNITISERETDYYITFKKGASRLDNISFDAYGDPNYGWLILMANQDIAMMEFLIPDNTDIRIPMPLNDALKEYSNKIDNYFENHVND